MIKTEVVGFRNFKFEFPFKDYIGCKLRKDGVWEPEILSFFDDIINPNWNIIDIGANWGYYSTYFGHLAYNGSVVSIEPQKLVYDLLLANLKSNGISNVVTINQAAYEFSKDLWLDSIDNHIYDQYINYGGLWTSTEPIENGEKVSSTTIDSLKVSGVDLIKIDAEGSELPILNGALQTIKSFQPVMVIEINLNRTEVLFLLDQLGYRYSQIGNSQHDYLCLPSGI